MLILFTGYKKRKILIWLFCQCEHVMESLLLFTLSSFRMHKTFLIFFMSFIIRKFHIIDIVCLFFFYSKQEVMN